MACKCVGQYKPMPTPRQRPTDKARAAQSAIARAIKADKIQRPEACSECGLQGRIEAAHHDYDEPLKVRWLCRSCHAKWDWAVPKGGTTKTSVKARADGIRDAREFTVNCPAA